MSIREEDSALSLPHMESTFQELNHEDVNALDSSTWSSLEQPKA